MNAIIFLIPFSVSNNLIHDPMINKISENLILYTKKIYIKQNPKS